MLTPDLEGIRGGWSFAGIFKAINKITLDTGGRANIYGLIR